MHRGMMLQVLAGTLLLAGCGNTMTNTANTVMPDAPPEGLRTGVQTTVGVRPDVLGASRELPVAANTENINGAAVSLRGTLVSSDGTWIVLDENEGGTRRWIRLEHVTWVAQPAPPEPTPDAAPPANAG